MSCNEWKLNKSVNPISHRKIQEDGRLFKTLAQLCSTSNTCSQFRDNQLINPLTKKAIKTGAYTHTLFKRMCDIEAQSVHRNSKSAEITSSAELVLSPTMSPLQCTEYATVSLKDHQKHVCKYIQQHKTPGMLLFHSVGSGKTITAITIIRCMLQKYPHKNVYVVTPTSLVENFHKELNKLNVKFNDNVKVYSHTTFVNKINSRGGKAFENSIIVVDEAHRFKSPKGAGTQAMLSAASFASNVFLLSATPVQNRREEFAPLFAMISKSNYTLPELVKLFQNGSDNELRKLLRHKVSYFKNNDTSDYPSVSYNDVTFHMTDQYYQKYKEVEDNNAEMFYGMFSSKDLAVFMNGVRRAVNHIDENIPTPKVEWAIDHIKHQHEKGRKVLVYSNWIRSGSKLIQDRLKAENIEWVEINGSMTSKKRKQAMNLYNSGNVTVLFISSAGSEGLDLKGTRSVILLEPHWNNEKIKQVIGRAVRYRSHADMPASEQHVDVYQLLITKPKYNRDKLPSADIFLKQLSDKKNGHINDFYDILIQSSI